MEITLHTQVEDLIEEHPDAVGFLADHNVVCIVCGEPYWGTLGELMEQKAIKDPDAIVTELKTFLAAHEQDAG